jgi:hypothetical protein
VKGTSLKRDIRVSSSSPIVARARRRLKCPLVMGLRTRSYFSDDDGAGRIEETADLRDLK